LLTHSAAVSAPLIAFTEDYTDLDHDGIIGDLPGEGVDLFFPMDENTFINNFMDGAANLFFIHNNRALTTAPIEIASVQQSIGDMAKLHQLVGTTAVPEPSVLSILALGGLLWLVVHGLTRNRQKSRPAQGAQTTDAPSSRGSPATCRFTGQMRAHM
jgi:hypothetical protein